MMTLRNIDKAENLQPRLYKATKKAGQRKVNRPHLTRWDAVSKAMARCVMPSDLAKYAMECGMKREEVLDRAARANNLGQYRMVLANRIRHILNG